MWAWESLIHWQETSYVLMDKTQQHYITEDGSKIEVIESNEHIVVGKIIESPIQLQVGHSNVFTWSELSEVK